MTDIKSALSRLHLPPAAGEAIAGDGLERLTSVVELIFFAYRDFTGESDAVLKEFDFGRAHHRVIHFVTWRPGLRVADLLEILKITKQSLARVLKQLVDRGFIVQEAGEADRRERRLYPTAKGRELAEKLRTLQTRRIADALSGIEPEARGTALRFLLALTAPADRPGIERALGQAGLELTNGQAVSMRSRA